MKRSEVTVQRWRRAVSMLLLALVLGGAGAALGWTAADRAQRVQKATAVVLINPLEGNAFNADAREGVLSLETESRLVTSDAVARAVAAKIGGDPRELQESVAVELPANTQLLRISASNADAERAAVVADGFAAEFLDYRATRTKAAVFDRRAHLREEVEVAKQELTRLTKEQASLGQDSPRRAVVDQQLSTAAVQVSQLQAELAALGYVSQDPGQVVTPAAVGTPGLMARSALMAGVGGALGLGAVVGVALVLRGRRVGSELDLVSAGHTVVGDLGSVDRVRARLLLTSKGQPFVLLVAEPARDHATTTLRVGEEVAVAFARARMATVHMRLTWSDLQDVATDRGHGLEELLLGKAELLEVLHPVGECLESLELTSPPAPGPWGDLLASPALPALLHELRERADMVVISGLTLPGASAEILLGLVDQVLIRVVQGETRHRDLERALAVASACSVPVGLVRDICSWDEENRA